MIQNIWVKTITSLYNASTGGEKLHNYEIGMLVAGIIVVIVVILLVRWLIVKFLLPGLNKPDEKQSGEAAEAEKQELSPMSERIGTLHNVGKRPNQQDSMGVAELEGGLLAVVSDGMGGLSDGDKVSQMAVKTLLSEANVTFDKNYNPLYSQLCSLNQQVNRMLGKRGLSKSGATLLMVLQMGDSFHWLTVGDSRIYLYCNGRLLQVNREHVYMQELMLEAVNGNGTLKEAMEDRQRKALTSFVGMGNLKHVESSMRAVPIARGDRILLMSDGVFNTLSEAEMCEILAENPKAADAARVMEERVLAHNNPKQDNFTAVILDY